MRWITSLKGLNASGGRKQQQKKVLRKTISDYVRFVSMFYFQFVPYVLDICYFFRYKSILSTVKFYINILRVLIIQNVAFFLSFLL